MKIMVIGEGAATAGVCEGMADDVGQGGSQVVHFRDAEQAMRDLERGDQGYAWVLIEDGFGDAHATAATVNARHRRLPVAVFYPVREGQVANPAPPALCAVETTSSGLQILRCALHCASQEPGGRESLHRAIDSQPTIFEYHAPCRKSR